MSNYEPNVLSKAILRVDAATPISDKRAEIHQRRASHTAIFAHGLCLGVTNVKNLDLPPEETTFGKLVEGQACTRVAESESVEELARLFKDSNVEALIVQDNLGEFVGVVTRQSLLEALLEERRQTEESCRQCDMTEQQRAESLLAGEKRIFEIISTSSSQDGGLTELVEFVESQCDGAICSILLLDDDGARLRRGAANSLPEAFGKVIDGMEIGPNAGACGTAAYLNQTVVVSDIASDPRCMSIRDLAMVHEIRSCWSNPIPSSSGTVLGTIAMYFKQPQRPIASHKALIDRAVYLAAIAIERRRAEDALRASETRNRTLLECSPVCTKIIDLDSRLRYMSTAGQHQLKICDIEPYYGSRFPPELYSEPWRAQVTEHLERAKAGEISSLECPVLDTEGREAWFDTTFVPARDENGRVNYVIVTSVNITERREVQDELRMIFDMSLDLICVATIDTATFVKVNRSFVRVLGCSEDELLGHSYLDFIHPDDVGPTVEVIERYLKQGKKVMRFENRFRAKEGDYRWLNWTSNPNPASGLTYAIAHDITDRKNADDQARKHRDELAHVSRVSTMGEMATGIAHELNQPLAAISSFSFAAKTILERLPTGPHEIEELLGKLEEQSIRAGEIVRRLRNYVAKTESVRMPFDLNTLVRDVAKFVEPDIRQADVTLTLKLDESSPGVMIDEIQIQQVVVNLIKNAIDALEETPAGHRDVTVSTRTLLDGHAEVIVSDAGKGLTQRELDQAFNTFFSTKHEGMGMGLPISRSIVEAHGGELWAKQNVGRGATFGFTLPYETGYESEGRPTVFIVDDEPAVRESLSCVVQVMGLSTKCFASAGEFLEVIEPYEISSPACLIVDMQMPTTTGTELLEQLVKMGKKLPVIMVTGHGSPALKRKAKELGAVAVLQKPFRPGELQEIISANLKQNNGQSAAQ